ncbi:MAG: HEAT repeat domain-containing protein [Aquificae bacterium]|nr:HEAT repeat domain-containing protein [Aquificota bacterium]
MFKKHSDRDQILIKRFREFDEARKYIEDISAYDTETVLSAVDYMITHQEYYYLLKNLYRQILEGKLPRNVYEYALMNMKVCPRRQEEKEIYLKILSTHKDVYTQPLVEFLKSCCGYLKEFNISLLKNYDPYIRAAGVDILTHCSDEEVKTAIKELAWREENPAVAEKIINYLKIYGEKDDKPLLEHIGERFPQLRELVIEAAEGI